MVILCYRLDRLFILLETGSSSVTRKAAANQLGQVVRLHPHELEPLLERISGYLRSSSWETRIAASQAIEAVIKQIPPWCPSGLTPVKLGICYFYKNLICNTDFYVYFQSSVMIC